MSENLFEVVSLCFVTTWPQNTSHSGRRARLRSRSEISQSENEEKLFGRGRLGKHKSVFRRFRVLHDNVDSHALSFCSFSPVFLLFCTFITRNRQPFAKFGSNRILHSVAFLGKSLEMFHLKHDPVSRLPDTSARYVFKECLLSKYNNGNATLRLWPSQHGVAIHCCSNSTGCLSHTSLHATQSCLARTALFLRANPLEQKLKGTNW